MYYEKNLAVLKDLFGTDEVELAENELIVSGHVYPIIDDVIVLLDKDQYPTELKQKLSLLKSSELEESCEFSESIQYTFGEEWKAFNQVLPEHEEEFNQYFDIVNLEDLAQKRVCDLGCGIGRWSYFLKDKVKELVLVDFSEAIFEARMNLRDAGNVLFFMGDIKKSPFKNNFSDLIFCLGVLHHLPSDALTEVRSLKRYAPQLLIYLYYALDNRPFYYRWLLSVATILRKGFSSIRNTRVRSILTYLITWLVYVPSVTLGHALEVVGCGKYIPLYEGYRGKGILRIRQDVYDRFFTNIEQRVTRKQIMELEDSFEKIKISKGLPYWHFLCQNS